MLFKDFFGLTVGKYRIVNGERNRYLQDPQVFAVSDEWKVLKEFADWGVVGVEAFGKNTFTVYVRRVGVPAPVTLLNAD